MHPDLKIKIPRKDPNCVHSARTQEYWDLVRKHGGSRKSMVEFICGIGGYSSSDINSAIEFNIKAYNCDLSGENLWKMVTSEGSGCGPAPGLPPEHMARAKALFDRVYNEHEGSLWHWGCEEAYEDWKDSDTPYETFTGRRVEWEWEVHGRSNGHLCMTECGNITLKRSTEDLKAALTARHPDGDDDYYCHSDVRDLFIICVQNTVDITHKRISEEIEYRAVWRLWVSFCEDELKTDIAEYAHREHLADGIVHIMRILGEDTSDTGEVSPLETFQAICRLADVKIPD